MTSSMMLDMLNDARGELSALLKDRGAWSSLFVNYETPYVERLWRPWREGRILLHRIHPCEKPLFHPHPCPSAMYMEEGSYEMAIGYGQGGKPPPVAVTVILQTGCAYDMSHPDGWHSVNPIGGPTLSIMVTGKPWNRWSPKSNKLLRALSDTEFESLYTAFVKRYP